MIGFKSDVYLITREDFEELVGGTEKMRRTKPRRANKSKLYDKHKHKRDKMRGKSR